MFEGGPEAFGGRRGGVFLQGAPGAFLQLRILAVEQRRQGGDRFRRPDILKLAHDPNPCRLRHSRVNGLGGEDAGQLSALSFRARARSVEGEALQLHLRAVAVFDPRGGEFGQKVVDGLLSAGKGATATLHREKQVRRALNVIVESVSICVHLRLS